MSQDVYATAQGPLARLASPVAARTRARRHARFFALFIQLFNDDPCPRFHFYFGQITHRT